MFDMIGYKIVDLIDIFGILIINPYWGYDRE